jgi:hypothetical protein
MTRRKSLRIGGALLLLAASLYGGGALAQNGEDEWTIQKPSAIEMFPKVVNEEDRDTCIQVSNTSNMPVYAHCFYTNGREVQGRPLWQVTDFSLTLTRQQPTHWCVGDGRRVSGTDDIKGIDPGFIPPVPVGFTGALVCVEVLASGEPSAANSLIGKATIVQVDDEGDLVAVSGYNGIGIQAVGAGDGDNVAELDDVEYRACPAGAHLNFVTEGFADDALDQLYEGVPGFPATSTTLAVIPCNMDFVNLEPSSTTLGFFLTDEFEGVLSTTAPVDCWAAINMGEVLGRAGEVASNPSTYRYARINAVGPNQQDPLDAIGFAAVANVVRTGADGSIASSATNLHFLGNDPDENLDPDPPSVIRINGADPFN